MGERAQIHRSEWRYALLLALLVLLLGSLPYMIGWATAEPGKVFGGFVFDVADSHSYLAKMQLGLHGSWKYRILFTAESHEPIYTYFFYIALGHVARLGGFNLVLLYHAVRLLAGLFLLLTAYHFSALFLEDRQARRVAYFFICFASGLGWLLLLLTGSFTFRGITPLDFWFIELNSFFTVMVFPHTSLAMAFVLIALSRVMLYLESRRLVDLLVAGLTGLGIAAIHPFMLLVVNLVLGLYWLLLVWQRRELRWRTVAGLAFFALVPLPLAGLQYIQLVSDPVMAAWQAQNYNFSPSPAHFVLGYGIVLLLALPGIYWTLQRQDARLSLLVIWVFVVAALLYMPAVFNLQRRVAEAIPIALSVLAAAGLVHIVLPALAHSRLLAALAEWGYPQERGVILARNLLLALALPSTGFLLVQGVATATQEGPGTVYDVAEVEMVEWISQHAPLDAVVLASYDMGGYIPAHSGRRTVIGHWAETIELEKKREAVQRFFADASDEERQQFLVEQGVDYVFYGPRERALGSFEPGQAPYLAPVVRDGDVTLYQVKTPKEG